MLSLRLGPRQWIHKETIKCIIHTPKLSANTPRLVLTKHFTRQSILVKAASEPKSRKLLIQKQIESLRALSVQTEPNSVNALKDSENYRSENNITISGENVPDPIQTIEDDTFPDYIMKYLRKEGIEKPSIIQAQGWPIAVSGKNLVGIAQTGTGKTLAYLIPAVLHIKEKSTRKGSGPVVLVLAPTRELARQIQQVADKLTRTLGIRTACVYGGASRHTQEMTLNRGVDLLIATPGRLIDFLTSKCTSLDRCTYVVLDEADRMLDMGFEPQIRQIADMIPLERQILMWSATWPKEVQALAQDYLGEYIQVNVGSTDLSANHDIKQIVYVCEEDEKKEKLQEVLQAAMDADSGKILIFANMKRTVEDVTHKLRMMGWPAVGIHGNKTQMQRDSIIHQFKHGKARILVASDVAARGLDVDNVTHVINFDYPTNSEDYIHRIGRTGRSGATGTSHSLLTPDNARQAKELISIMQEANQEISEDLEELASKHHLARDKPKYKPRKPYTSNWSSRNRFGSGRENYSRDNYSRDNYNKDNYNRDNYNRRPRRENKWDSDD